MCRSTVSSRASVEALLHELLATIRIGGAACGTGIVTTLLRHVLPWTAGRRVYPDEIAWTP